MPTLGKSGLRIIKWALLATSGWLWVGCDPKHSVIPSSSQTAEELQSALQGKGGMYYAGAWCGYGFHEDGLKAGMAAAVALGASIPWKARATCPKISLTDSFFMGTFDKFARMAISMGSLRLILPNGEERLYGSQQPPPAVPGAAWPLHALWTVHLFLWLRTTALGCFACCEGAGHHREGGLDAQLAMC